VLSLSLGIAANTTIFSFVNVLLLRPPPVESPEQLWQVWRQNLKGSSVLERYQPLSYPAYAFFRDHNRSFRALAAFDPETPFVSWNRNGLGQAVQAQFVSGDFFAACRTDMAMGRAFGPQEDRRPAADPVAVLSHGFWQASLGGDPQVVGRTLGINGVSLTVVGVAPAGFTGLVVLAGLIGAVAATRVLRSLLLGISPLDPVTFALVSLLLAVVAALACLLPARRAAGIDPSEALRRE
jgi:MacB-like periplasmic core domain